MNPFEKILMSERVRLGIVCGNHQQRLEAIRVGLEGAITQSTGEGEDESRVELEKSNVIDLLGRMKELEDDMTKIVKSIYAHMLQVSQTEVDLSENPELQGAEVEGDKVGDVEDEDS